MALHVFVFLLVICPPSRWRSSGVWTGSLFGHLPQKVRPSGSQTLESMRLWGDGKHGHVERIQTFRCQACRTALSARRNTPLYRLKTPSHQIAMVRITRWPKS